MSASDYTFLDEELEDLLDAWFAHDHYDDNPAYSLERQRGGLPMKRARTIADCDPPPVTITINGNESQSQ